MTTTEDIMKHCKQCGQKVENNELKYCTNCGEELDTSTKTQETAAKIPSKKPLTKRQKLTAVIASGAAVLLIVLYFIGAHFTSHERLVKNFEATVGEADAKKLAKTLNFQ